MSCEYVCRVFVHTCCAFHVMCSLPSRLLNNLKEKDLFSCCVLDQEVKIGPTYCLDSKPYLRSVS